MSFLSFTFSLRIFPFIQFLFSTFPFASLFPSTHSLSLPFIRPHFPFHPFLVTLSLAPFTLPFVTLSPLLLVQSFNLPLLLPFALSLWTFPQIPHISLFIPLLLFPLSCLASPSFILYLVSSPPCNSSSQLHSFPVPCISSLLLHSVIPLLLFLLYSPLFPHIFLLSLTSFESPSLIFPFALPP